MFNFSECPDCIFDKSKMWKVELFQKLIWFRREFSPAMTMEKTNKAAAEGIRGTIQNFFLPYSNYSITILMMDKLNIFLEINFLNFLVVFPALFF